MLKQHQPMIIAIGILVLAGFAMRSIRHKSQLVQNPSSSAALPAGVTAAVPGAASTGETSSQQRQVRAPIMPGANNVKPPAPAPAGPDPKLLREAKEHPPELPKEIREGNEEALKKALASEASAAAKLKEMESCVANSSGSTTVSGPMATQMQAFCVSMAGLLADKYPTLHAEYENKVLQQTRPDVLELVQRMKNGAQ